MSAPGLFQSSPPDVAVEISAQHVGAAYLTWRGRSATVTAHSVEPLPPGAVVPALAAVNLPDVAVVGKVVAQAIEKLGVRARRAALVIPDTVAKVSLVRFEKVPAKGADLLELVRWQIRKSAPFPLEQAVVSYTPGIMVADGGQEFLVAAARTDIIEQYQSACAHAGLQTGLVDLSTFSVINGVLAGTGAPAGDWLLVHATSHYVTLAVVRDADVIFFRNRSEETEGTLTDVVHQTAMYYEDRLKGAGFSRVLLAGGAASGGSEALRRNLEERLQLSVEPVDPRAGAALVDRISASPDLMEALSPLIGILLRERAA
jgi:Tfp pilus assembly PilM family ATPase